MRSPVTKTGDDGTTMVPNLGRVAKSHPLVAALGEVDELQAMLLFAANVAEPPYAALLREFAQHLFFVGGVLCKHEQSEADCVAALSVLEAHLQALPEGPEGFSLPPEEEARVRLNLVRTVCRRAERAVCAAGFAGSCAMVYLNRLSDLLYLVSYA